jgi:hypothetical protein
VTPYREFERQFGGKTVLAGLRLKNSSQKSHLKFEVCFDFFPWHQVIFIFSAPTVSDCGVHEEMELISTRHFDKFSVWSQKS